MRMNDGSLNFQIRSKMVKTIAFNYSSDPKFSTQLWHFTHCDRMDSQSHVLTCESYKYLREGKDLSSDQDLGNTLEMFLHSERRLNTSIKSKLDMALERGCICTLLCGEEGSGAHKTLGSVELVAFVANVVLIIIMMTMGQIKSNIYKCRTEEFID